MTDIEYIINLWNLCPDEYRQKVLQLLKGNAESTAEKCNVAE